jgi:hypothetical protein
MATGDGSQFIHVAERLNRASGNRFCLIVSPLHHLCRLLVGCGSVGLIRTCSSAKAGEPIKRQSSVGRLKDSRFMFTSPLAAACVHGVGALPSSLGLAETGLARRKALIPSISFLFGLRTGRCHPARGVTLADIDALPH